MQPDARSLEVQSERVYIVYDGKSGNIAHVHRVFIHRGAADVGDEHGEKRALEMAQRFGHQVAKMRVLRAAKFDGALPQRVDVKKRELVEMKVSVGKKRLVTTKKRS